MLTIREKIIAGFVDSIADLATSAVERCTGFRDDVELPALTVWDLDEDTSRDAFARRNCSMPLVVEYIDSSDKNPSSAANDMLGALIEAALKASFPDVIVDDLDYTASSFDFPTAKGVVIVRAIFTVEYYWTDSPFTQE